MESKLVLRKHESNQKSFDQKLWKKLLKNRKSNRNDIKALNALLSFKVIERESEETLFVWRVSGRAMAPNFMHYIKQV